MKALIAYASKYGFTKQCVELLASKMTGPVDTVDLTKSIPDVSKYDKVIIGGPIYAGQIRKQIKQFCRDNLDQLKDKKVGLFVCGMNKDEAALKQLEDVFPKELQDIACVKTHFGGGYDFNKMNFFEGFIMKKISGTNQNQFFRIDENIELMAKAMQ